MKFPIQGRMAAALWFASLAVLAYGLAPAAAATIQRCIGPHGEPLFAARCANPVAPTPARSSAVPADVAVTPRAADYCARTPASLAQRVGAAVQARNGVRLSGFALWRDMPARIARSEARDLVNLLRASSVSVALSAPSDIDTVPWAPMLLMLRVSERAGITRTEQWMFRIVRDRGCYWFDPQPERRHGASPAESAIAAEQPLPDASYVGGSSQP